MVITTNLRIMRLRYGISLVELERYHAFSNQYLSKLELGEANRTPYNEAVVEEAITLMIASRKQALAGLEHFFEAHRGHLLETLEVESDEL